MKLQYKKYKSMKTLKLTLVIVLAGVGFLSFNNGEPTPKVGLEVGDQLPALHTQLIDGQDFDLNKMSGKMVLIDFWASYHGPSRISNFQKERLRKKFAKSTFHNGHGLEVVAISLDRFMSPLQQAIELDGTHHFHHICDFKGQHGTAAVFDITTPMSILIDGDGRIVSKSTSLNKISDALSFLVRN
jgi:peroxiredoxin